MSPVTSLAEIITYESQDMLLPDNGLIYSWDGFPEERIEEIIDNELKQKFSELGISYGDDIRLALSETARNFYQYASGRHCCFDMYSSCDSVVAVASSTGIDYTKEILKIKKRKLPTNIFDCEESGAGTRIQLQIAKRMGFIRGYKSPNSNYKKVQDAFYMVIPLEKNN